MNKYIFTQELINGKKTCPSWSTESCYELKAKTYKEQTEIYYKTRSNQNISRSFPRRVNLTPNLCYALGLLKGEGSNKLGKSNYRRLTITNSEPAVINQVLNELNKNKIFLKKNLRKRSVHLIHHTKPEEEVIKYWSKKLELSKNKFKCFEDKRKTTYFGVCHIYISDVLLRIVIDLIHETFLK